MKQLIIILLLLCALSAKSDTSLDPQLECCSDIYATLKIQEKNSTLILGELKLIKEELKHTHPQKPTPPIVKIEEKEKSKSNVDWLSLFSILLGAVIGAVVSGGIAIWIFKRGERNEKKKAEKRLVDFGKQIHATLDKLIPDLNQEKEMLEKYVDSLREQPHTHGIYQRVNLQLMKRAREFDTTLVFDTFRHLGLDDKTYVDYYKDLDFLDDVINCINNDHNKHNTNVVTKLSNDFLRKTDDIFVGFESLDVNFSEELTPFQVIKKRYKKLKTPKIKEELKKNTSSHEMEKTSTLYENITKQAGYLANDISKQIKYIQESIDNLKKIKKQIKTQL